MSALSANQKQKGRKGFSTNEETKSISEKKRTFDERCLCSAQLRFSLDLMFHLVMKGNEITMAKWL